METYDSLISVRYDGCPSLFTDEERELQPRPLHPGVWDQGER